MSFSFHFKIILLAVICLISTNKTVASSPHFRQLHLTGQQVENLIKISRLYACARYFCPNPYTEELDWHIYLEEQVEFFLSITEEEQIDSLLIKEFSTFIPQLSFGERKNCEVKLHPPVYIKATNLNIGYNSSVTSSRILKINEEKDLPNRQYQNIKLRDSLYIHYPIFINEVPSKSIELTQIIEQSRRKWKNDFYTSPYYRLANAIINDAYIQHFYAYYSDDELDKVWENSTKEYLSKVAACSSYQEYLEVSYMHYSCVNDSHLYVMNGYSKPNSLFGRYEKMYYPDLVTACVEGNICVVDAGNEKMKLGDIIQTINDKPVDKVIAEKKKYVSASTNLSKLHKLCEEFLFQSFTKDSLIKLTLKDAQGELYTAAVKTRRKSPRMLSSGKFISQIDDSIWVINPCVENEVRYSKFCKYIPQLQTAKGIIIDLRGYPSSCIMPILSHFIDSTMTVGNILTPTFYYPDHYNVKYDITPSSKWGIHPATEQYKEEWEYEKPLPVKIDTQVYFLTDYKAISFAETILEMIKHYRIGKIIGEPTAGTNGDAVIINSPTIGVIFTGFQFFTYDGKKHHGIGIQPDVECSLSLEDLRNGKDTQLLKACEIINKTQNNDKSSSHTAISAPLNTTFNRCN